jgi:hypothetical protein
MKLFSWTYVMVMWPLHIMDMWICGMGMWMLHNGYVGETQEDLSIVPCKGDGKKAEKGHMKNLG